MPFEYSCFISYSHGQYDLTKRFVEELTDALKIYIEPYLGKQVYIDRERLKPGYHFNEALSEAICQSVCMIVVYWPTYEEHQYCLREYAAMEALEEKRFNTLGEAATREKGMIIPIILRGEDELPPKIKGKIHYSDFSKFTLAETSIKNKPEYIEKIEEIAKHIRKLYRAFQDSGKQICKDCSSFTIPAETDLRPWREEASVAPFPLREEGR